MSRDAFGPNLRRLRLQRQLTVEQIAASTKIAASLFHGLERNDFARWPNGVYARAYIRQYAEAVGADPDQAVDEFCRWFPQGDRRTERVVREHAEIIGHDLQWKDAPPEQVGERRGQADAPSQPAPQPQSPVVAWMVRVRRVLGGA
jgi:transcriptional regulator with XRE-family HTH domain